MRELTSTVTTKGQVTIPRAIRRALGCRPVPWRLGTRTLMAGLDLLSGQVVERLRSREFVDFLRLLHRPVSPKRLDRNTDTRQSCRHAHPVTLGGAPYG